MTPEDKLNLLIQNNQHIDPTLCAMTVYLILIH
jgi:hypothetical protein